MKQFARLVEMYKQLGNYTRDLIKLYTLTGVPLQRPLFYHYPDDSLSQRLSDQYMYGEDLVVAPVLQVSNRHLYSRYRAIWVATANKFIIILYLNINSVTLFKKIILLICPTPVFPRDLQLYVAIRNDT